MANNRFKRNLIGSIKVEGVVIEDPIQIKAAAVNHFSKIFTQGIQAESFIEGSFPRILSPTSASLLEREFVPRKFLLQSKTVIAQRLQGLMVLTSVLSKKLGVL